MCQVLPCEWLQELWPGLKQGHAPMTRPEGQSILQTCRSHVVMHCISNRNGDDGTVQQSVTCVAATMAGWGDEAACPFKTPFMQHLCAVSHQFMASLLSQLGINVCVAVFGGTCGLNAVCTSDAMAAPPPPARTTSLCSQELQPAQYTVQPSTVQCSAAPRPALQQVMWCMHSTKKRLLLV